MGLFDRLRRASPLTPAAAAAGAQAGTFVLVDVRERAEYESGHAPEAVNVPLAQVTSLLGGLAGPHDEIAFVCRSGARSALAVRSAARRGVPARNVRGGMLAWQRAGLPTVIGEAPSTQTSQDTAAVTNFTGGPEARHAAGLPVDTEPAPQSPEPA